MSKISELEERLGDLHKMRQLIERGWCKATYRKAIWTEEGDQTQYCFMGAAEAIDEARPYFYRQDCGYLLVRFINRHSYLIEPICNWESWNDKDEHTHTEVLQMIDKIINICSEGSTKSEESFNV